MPCRDYATDAEMKEYDRLELDRARQTNKALKAKLDETTRLLCKATKIMDVMHVLVEPDLIEWYTKHQEEDRLALIESALAKLTPAEVHALGLDSPSGK